MKNSKAIIITELLETFRIALDGAKNGDTIKRTMASFQLSRLLKQLEKICVGKVVKI